MVQMPTCPSRSASNCHPRRQIGPLECGLITPDVISRVLMVHAPAFLRLDLCLSGIYSCPNLLERIASSDHWKVVPFRTDSSLDLGRFISLPCSLAPQHSVHFLDDPPRGDVAVRCPVTIPAVNDHIFCAQTNLYMTRSKTSRSSEEGL